MRVAIWILMIVVATSFTLYAQETPAQPDPMRDAFWAKFQAAVGSNDKNAVAAMTGFPLSMPYGVRSIRNKAQLLSRYNKIFDAETKKCFATERPHVEEGDKKKFSIWCGEAMMYWFELRKGQYRFVGVDNVNE
jgi:hypothetical protein